MLIEKCLTQPLALSLAYQNVYNAPANTVTTIRKLTLTNAGTAAAVFTINLTPSAAGAVGVPAATDQIISSKTIGPKETKEIFEVQNHVLQPLDSVQVIANSLPAGAAVNLRMSGFEDTSI